MRWTTGYTVLSVNWQNFGNAQELWASQAFPSDAYTAYVQVVNGAITSTDWRLVVVVDTDGDVAEVEPGDVEVLGEAPFERSNPS